MKQNHEQVFGKHKPKRPIACCGYPQNEQQKEWMEFGYPYICCTRLKGHKGAHGAWGFNWK